MGSTLVGRLYLLALFASLTPTSEGWSYGDPYQACTQDSDCQYEACTSRSSSYNAVCDTFVAPYTELACRISCCGYASDLMCPLAPACNSTPGFYCTSLVDRPQGIICPAGMYCPGGDADAIPCPPNKNCPTGSSEPQPCEGGCLNCSQYSVWNQSAMTCKCWPGYTLNGRQECVLCEYGKYKPWLGNEPCMSCGPRRYWEFGTPHKCKCIPGYKEEYGVCYRVCSSDRECDYTGCSSLNGIRHNSYGCSNIGAFPKCRAETSLYNIQNNRGPFCANGSSMSSTCRNCPPDIPVCNASAGYTCFEIWQNRPTGIICPQGFYCSGGSDPPLSCTTAGYYCPEMSTSPNATVCPAGYYCDGVSRIPVQCHPHRTSEYGSKSSSDCYCREGYYGPQGAGVDGGSCVAVGSDRCPAGSSTLSGLLWECKCDAGFTGNDGEECIPCPPGSYKAARGNSSCLLCPAGKFSSKIAADSESACLPCMSHSNSAAGSTSNDDCLCDEGYKKDVNVSGNCIPTDVRSWFMAGSCQSCTDKCASIGRTCANADPAASYVKTIASFLGYPCDDIWQSIPEPYPAPGMELNHYGYTCNRCCVYGASGVTCDSVSVRYDGGCYSYHRRFCKCDPHHDTDGYYTENDGSITLCSIGFYCQGGVRHSCPENMTSSEGMTSVNDCICKPGLYRVSSSSSSSSSSSCSMCPGGTYSKFAGSSACVTCPPGAFSIPGSSSCQTCALGTRSTARSTYCFHDPCPVGTYQINASCLPCPLGHFSDTPGSIVCQPCQPGTYMNSTSGASACSKCLSQEYSFEGSYFCSCKAGYAAVSASFYLEAGSSCGACPANTYRRLLAQDGCTACPANSFSLPGSAACSCLPGFERLESELQVLRSCEPCAAGYFSNGSDVCAPCPLDSYAELGGSTTCVRCPQRSFTSAMASTSLFDCQCFNGTFFDHDKGLCEQCPPGYWCTSGQMFVCPVNSASLKGSDDASNCECKDGFTETALGSCVTCPANYWCANASKFACPANSTSRSGSAMRADCQCLAGFMLAEDGECTPCLKGLYCNSSRSDPCPANSSSPIGAMSIAQCQCERGFYRQADKCHLCPQNFFCSGNEHMSACAEHALSEAGASDVRDCSCQDGWYQYNNSCNPCPKNSFCVKGLKYSCPTNSTSKPLASSLQACICPAGMFGMNGTMCRPCKKGAWCFNGNQSLCPEGMTSDPMSSSVQDCRCKVGYSLLGDACASCPAGTYKDTEGPTTCTPCPMGTYLDGAGGRSPSDCVQCPNGSSTRSLASESDRNCTCRPGFYSLPRDKTGGQLVCVSCPIGFFKPSYGKSDCSPCAEGSFAAQEGSIFCQSCPSYSSSSMNRSFCECNPGYFESSGECFPCQAGTYSAHHASTACLQCEAGMYSMINGATFCIECPFNMTSASGSSNCSCVAGFFELPEEFIVYNNLSISESNITDGSQLLFDDKVRIAIQYETSCSACRQLHATHSIYVSGCDWDCVSGWKRFDGTHFNSTCLPQKLAPRKSLSSCKFNHTWQELIDSNQLGKADVIKTGGLGAITIRQRFEVYICEKDHECVDRPGDFLCFVYDEQGGIFYPWNVIQADEL
eukprot:766358-Hanusia_phi.AAC.1